MQRSKVITRRRFLASTVTTGAAGLSAPYILSPNALANRTRVGANDRLQIGLIGAGGMGRANLDNCAADPDVEVTGVCDVWARRREPVLAKYKSAKPYTDFRQLLAADDLDGVIIATPPHWHCLIAVSACEAGKDIYLQKPMTIYPAESLALQRAVEMHGRVSQIGTQIHAGENYRRVVEWIRSGRLGKISVARTMNVMNQGPSGLGNVPESAPPNDLDWEMWVGPAPMRTYHPLITRSAYENCSFMQFSGGWTPGMAPHIVDLPYWALELGIPQRTSCTGGRYVTRDAGDAPDTQEVVWQFPKQTLTWSMSTVNSYAFDFGSGTPARRLGIYFHGTNGTLYANYGMHQIVPEGDRLADLTPPAKSIAPSPGHELEWLQCMRSRQQPSCSVAYHYKIDLALNLANLSMQVSRDVHVDPKTGAIQDDPAAAKLAQPVYRDPWKFPAEYL
jgi:predicted dehydrogenase